MRTWRWKKVQRRFLVIGGVTLILGTALVMSPWALVAERHLTYPMLFWLRQAVGREPVLDPRIKIFAFDDTTVERLGLPTGLPDADWIAMIAALAARGPRAILLDFVWGAPLRDGKDAPALQALMAGAVPIATGAFLAPQVIPWRRPLTNSPSLVAPDSSSNGASNPGTQIAYGPIKEIEQVSRHIGQLNYDTPGWITPVAFTADGFRLPHMAIRAAREWQWHAHHLLIEGQPVPVGDDGRIFLNWLHPANYYHRILRVADISDFSKRGIPVHTVGADDVVIVLPELYTGNGDFKETAVGQVPGGYALVAAVNSVLTGRWLRELSLGPLGVFGAILLAGLFNRSRRSQWVAFALIGGELALVSAVLAAFLFADVIVEAVPTALSFAFAGTALLVRRMHRDELLSSEMTQALKGVVAPDILARISREPESFRITPSDQLVTIMFLDFVGFSNLAERMEPQNMFRSLELIFAEVTAIVHEHNGVVDKTIGDGLMAFFGFNPVTCEIDATHADRALSCGVAIQRHLARLVAERQGTDQPTFPARIGLNTGRVHVGNLGGSRRFDVTVIGHTVNLAKRFEDSGEPFKVLLGANTYGLLGADSLGRRFHVRETKIKHKSDFMKVYECDPFAEDPSVLAAAIKAHRAFARLERATDRNLLPTGIAAWVKTEKGERGTIRDYSPGGVCVVFPQRFFANRAKLAFSLHVSDGGAHTFDLGTYQAYIRWGRSSTDGYLHGLEWEDPKPNLTVPIAALSKQLAMRGAG